MSVRVKICGIRTKEAALTAVRAGADFLGFNFVSTSKRCIMPEIAYDITEYLSRHMKIVGVFQNEKLEEVKRIIEYLKLDFVQLHGDESKDYCKELTQYAGVIKVFRLYSRHPELVSGSYTDAEGMPKQVRHDNIENMIDEMKTYNVDYFLLDREKQGEGELIDLTKAQIIASKFPIFIAGGLTAENVKEVVRHVTPYAVDVARGIETDGKEKEGKIKEFIRNAKNI